MWKGSVTEAAEWLTCKVLSVTEDWVPKRTVEEDKGTHPWLNERALKAVNAKHGAEGTIQGKDVSVRCSEVILEE